MIPVVETKSVTDDVASAFDDFARAFEAFKDANDTRLSQIETRLTSDVVTDEKLARIDTALDDAKRRLVRAGDLGRTVQARLFHHGSGHRLGRRDGGATADGQPQAVRDELSSHG